MGLGEARYRNVDTYRAGMKQRIKLAQALVHDPDLLFLDEPTNGMDPRAATRCWNSSVIWRTTRCQPHSVVAPRFQTSSTCDHVVVADKGPSDCHGRPHRSVEAAPGPCLRITRQDAWNDLEAFFDRLRAAGLDCHATDDDIVRVFVPGDGGARQLFQLAAAAQVQVRHLRPSVPTLEDVFAHAVGEP